MSWCHPQRRRPPPPPERCPHGRPVGVACAECRVERLGLEAKARAEALRERERRLEEERRALRLEERRARGAMLAAKMEALREAGEPVPECLGFAVMVETLAAAEVLGMEPGEGAALWEVVERGARWEERGAYSLAMARYRAACLWLDVAGYPAPEEYEACSLRRAHAAVRRSASRLFPRERGLYRHLVEAMGLECEGDGEAARVIYRRVLEHVEAVRTGADRVALDDLLGVTRSTEVAGVEA